ncbi:cryptochrome/photolyase family protein [Actinoalloteichus spitiensis]|uniref:cryptochrome/photolyase family protein n=1 Tax=Actinoalloteichus spitiensis TaxID=252394 RepID=UPI000363B339|nr:deoxyribodipyrimidine photo-lyase [Actinoalloteichus spitiensis]
MPTAVALLTRDLRVHDNPVLSAAASADHAVPVFVLDDVILRGGHRSPNRVAFLLDCLRDLRRQLRDLGGDLLVTRGDPVREVVGLAERFDAATVHVAADVSAYATGRARRLSKALSGAGRELVVHDTVVTVAAPGELAPQSRDHFAVFTPYFRHWREHHTRGLHPAPKALRLPPLRPGGIPGRADLVDGDVSPSLPTGGESEGRRLLDDWLDDGVHHYASDQDRLARDGTSRLSAYLHFGCVSPTEIAQRVGESDGERAFLRQLAWRDFHHQVLAARPGSAWNDYRTRNDHWRTDHEELAAWRDGRTGVPLVDAGMRQLATEGWMHNRARLVTASFLTKSLYLDWREGARHFLRLLVDGDIANNNMNWQWVAGTGTDTRPNRVLNPTRQAERYDPDGAYVRRYVPELADLAPPEIHEPWRLGEEELRRRDYPPPLVDLMEAARRFRAARGKD